MSKESLENIEYKPNYHPWSTGVAVSSSEMRALIREIFDSERVYTFFRTVGNPEAVKLLEGYVGKREGSEPWVVSKGKAHGCTGFGQEKKSLRLDSHLMSDYLHVLEELAKEEFGDSNYRQFQLVRGAFSMDAPPEALSWPVIHIVKSTGPVEKKYLGELVDSLAGKKVHAILRKREEPQNYRTGEIDTLHKHSVSPIVLEDRVWVCQGRELKNAVDFLMPFTFDSGKLRYSCRHCDDD